MHWKVMGKTIAHVVIFVGIGAALCALLHRLDLLVFWVFGGYVVRTYNYEKGQH